MTGESITFQESYLFEFIASEVLLPCPEAIDDPIAVRIRGGGIGAQLVLECIGKAIAVGVFGAASHNV